VLDKETAHTKPFEEVKDSLRAPLLLSQADKQASDIADQMSVAIRKSNKTSLDDLANQYKLILGETRPVGATDPCSSWQFPRSKGRHLPLRAGELSLPIRTDRGYVVLSLKTVLPAHQATVEEVRDKIIAELKREKAAELARNQAEELVNAARPVRNLRSRQKLSTRAQDQRSAGPRWIHSRGRERQTA